MAAVTVRNIPEETHRALKLRANAKGTSTEAEIRSILEEAVKPRERLKMGTELAAIGKTLGVRDWKLTRDPRPAEPAKFK